MEDKIIKLLSEVKENQSLAETLDTSADIINGVGLDSIQMINFMLRIEEETGIDIDFDTFDFSNLSSVKTLADYLKERV